MPKKNKQRKTQYIFVLGGVMSGVGKGVTTSSIAKILQFSGFKVSAVKIDPYVNVDSGTMNPFEHGETFVLNDGYETDQDMGNYERFLNTSLTRDSYMTTGSIYQKVIAQERSLFYKGKTVEVVPHVPLAIIDQIKRAAQTEQAEIMMIEIGGTVGEYQNILFLEAARMMKRQSPDDVLFVLVSYLPVPSRLGEMKTKPTQQAVRFLSGSGIHPDIIVGRSILPMDEVRKEKIAAASLLQVQDIISAPDVDTIYHVPDHFISEGLDIRILKKLKRRKRKSKQSLHDQRSWDRFARTHNTGPRIQVALVGKYVTNGDFVLPDAYLSVLQALKFSGTSLGYQVQVDVLAAEKFEGRSKKTWLNKLSAYDAVVVPGGFGETGIDGKINVIHYVREHKIPFLGICLGMQLASVEFAQNILGKKQAQSTEINSDTPDPVVIMLPEQEEKLRAGDYGGSMRLGSYEAVLKKGSVVRKIYRSDRISERHRHRYELNDEYADAFEKHGLHISGRSVEGGLPEIIELDRLQHPFFVGVQFHPEFKARPLNPHPLFTGLLRAVVTLRKKEKSYSKEKTSS